MADYKHAIKRILTTEGGYVNDKNDAGGETYKGIARNFWPKWMGWVFIDPAKKLNGFPTSLEKIVPLQEFVIQFYKQNFWDKIGGDLIADQDIADMLVDSAENEGIKPAIKRAQSIVTMAQTGIITPELVTKLSSMI